MIYRKWDLLFTDKYCIGSDNELYRLSYESNGKNYSLRKCKLIIRETKGYWIYDKNGNQTWWSLNKLRKQLVLCEKKEVLIEIKETPW